MHDDNKMLALSSFVFISFLFCLVKWSTQMAFQHSLDHRVKSGLREQP